MVLAHEQNLDGEVRVRQQRWERNQLVEHLDGRAALGGATDRDDLAVLVDSHDPPLERDRVHDPDAVLVQQRVELRPERAEPAGLHFNELSVGSDEIDHEPAHSDLLPVARDGQHRLQLSVQRSLAQHADAGHLTQPELAPAPLIPLASPDAGDALAASLHKGEGAIGRPRNAPTKSRENATG